MNEAGVFEQVQVDPERAQDLMRKGAWLIDVRPATSHRAERIAGAYSLPLTQLEARLGELPPGVALIFY